MPEWIAGAAGFDITPPPGVDMTGYAGRPGPADRVLDRLYVRALAIAAPGEPPVVLTGADLLGIDGHLVEQIRERVREHVAPERLLLNHSHTHAGPTTASLRCMGVPDPAYGDMVVRWTAGAVAAALREMRPARLAFGTAPTAIGINRRELRQGRIVLGENPSGAYDPAVSVLRVEEECGRPLACWFSHATHPVVMGPKNTGLSAEWPGAAAAALQNLLACPAVFAQGCCGDINPVRRGGHDVAVSVGRELAGAALAAWERAEPVERGGTAAALEKLLLPQRQPTPEEAEAALAEARERVEALTASGELEPEPPGGPSERARRQYAPGILAWARDYVLAAAAAAAPPAPMDVQVIRLGDVAIAATGAETFVEIGRRIQASSPVARTVALGYSNGCFGYLPTASAYPEGGYEVDAAFKFYGTLMVTPEAEALTVSAAVRLLERVR